MGWVGTPPQIQACGSLPQQRSRPSGMGEPGPHGLVHVVILHIVVDHTLPRVCEASEPRQLRTLGARRRQRGGWCGAGSWCCAPMKLLVEAWDTAVPSTRARPTVLTCGGGGRREAPGISGNPTMGAGAFPSRAGSEIKPPHATRARDRHEARPTRMIIPPVAPATSHSGDGGGETARGGSRPGLW